METSCRDKIKECRDSTKIIEFIRKRFVFSTSLNVSERLSYAFEHTLCIKCTPFFVCLFVLILNVPVTHFFSHVGMGLPGLNRYY